MADINSTNLSTEAPDFSMLALFMQADLVVKSVIIILILALLFLECNNFKNFKN